LAGSSPAVHRAIQFLFRRLRELLIDLAHAATAAIHALMHEALMGTMGTVYHHLTILLSACSNSA